MRAGLFLAIAALGGVALASPPRRVVVLDPDPELRQAIEVALRPWHIEVVTTPDPNADFTVSREDDQLVVKDRAHATMERRPARAGVLDPVSAAESALTVKTMMRLPPPAQDNASNEVAVAASPEPAVQHDGFLVRVQLGGALTTTDINTVADAQLGVFVRPWSGGLRVGVRGEIGGSTDVDAAGFKGTWSEAAVIGIASVSREINASFELEPWLGAGVVRSVLDGTMMNTDRRETDVGARIAGGLVVRYVRSAFSVGAGLELDVSPGRPTYTKDTPGNGMPAIFQASEFGVTAGVVAAIELGR